MNRIVMQAARRAAPETSRMASALPPIVHRALRSSGRPLDPPTQAFMGSRFNFDFSRVRVHTDATAAASARAINALAYTAGHHVVFGLDQSPARAGSLAHELAHVVQQNGRAQESLPETLTLGSPEAAAETEAERMAEQVVRGGGDRVGPSRQPLGPSLQRQPDDGAPSAGPRLGEELELDLLRLQAEMNLLRLRLADDPEEILRLIRQLDFNPSPPQLTPPPSLTPGTGGARLTDPSAIQQAVESSVAASSATPPGLFPASIPPAPAGGPAAPLPSPLAPVQPYPGTGGDLLSAGLATPYGQRFKSFAVGELEQVWERTTPAEKVLIGINLATVLGMLGYGLASMPAEQRQGVVNTIIEDNDVYLQRPLDKKVLFSFQGTF